MGSLGIAWVHLELHGFTWNCMGSLGIAWVHLELHGFTWNCMGSLGIAWVHLELHGFTWNCMGSLGIAQIAVSKLSTLRALFESTSHSPPFSVAIGILACLHFLTLSPVITIIRHYKLAPCSLCNFKCTHRMIRKLIN